MHKPQLNSMSIITKLSNNFQTYYIYSTVTLTLSELLNFLTNGKDLTQ